jgi:NAD+ synthase
MDFMEMKNRRRPTRRIAMLEWAMLEEESGKSTSDFTGRQKEVFDIYKKLNTTNQHKMNAIPVCKINR